MFQTHFDAPTLKKPRSDDEKRLAAYRIELARIAREHDSSCHEYALVHAANSDVVSAVRGATKHYKGIKHVIVVGIGGSSLGLEAVHNVLGEQGSALTVLDMIDPQAITTLTATLSKIKKVSQLAICLISKSGTTTETLANSAVVLRMLEAQYGEAVYKQLICIGDPGTPLAKTTKKLGATYIAMPVHIGGRYSVGTEVALVPLALLGHDIEAFTEGIKAAGEPGAEEATAASALRLASYLRGGYRHYNFFAFEQRLYKLGAWYRQLAAESLGKHSDRDGKPFTLGWVPTISTPVELHSVGQLYLSGFPGVYTEFVSIDDNAADYKVGPTKLAPQLKKFSLTEIATALYGGVVGAYQAQGLPHRATVLSDNLPYALGYYMASAMRETMYIAHIFNVNAFDQPSVELYKEKTRSLLNL